MELTTGSAGDFAAFAGWHYRSHRVGLIRFVTVLWHGERAIGVCVFTTPARSLRGRNRFFGHSGQWSRLSLQQLNRQVVTLSRVVLHPTYRGAGLGSRFVAASVRACPSPWVEALAAMGRVHPFFERAGFVRVETGTRLGGSVSEHSALYGGQAYGRRRELREETHRKSAWSQPVYFICDNRDAWRRQQCEGDGEQGAGAGAD